VDAIELFFTSLLVLVSIIIVWFAAYVVYKLYQGQS
jgi:flagellar biogenesis protein FliO